MSEMLHLRESSELTQTSRINIITLEYIKGYSMEEIAACYKVSTERVRQVLIKSRRQLKAYPAE